MPPRQALPDGAVDHVACELSEPAEQVRPLGELEYVIEGDLVRGDSELLRGEFTRRDQAVSRVSIDPPLDAAQEGKVELGPSVSTHCWRSSCSASLSFGGLCSRERRVCSARLVASCRRACWQRGMTPAVSAGRKNTDLGRPSGFSPALGSPDLRALHSVAPRLRQP